MVKFITVEGKRKCVVTSATVGKEYAPHLNRAGRRDIVYARPVMRLLDRIWELRKDMHDAGISPGPLPRFKNRKYLSGYMSGLVRRVSVGTI